MRTAGTEDLLSLVPPLMFVAASYVASWKPNESHPYGYHRAVPVAFLISAAAPTTIGGWLLVESVYKLVTAEHPTVGSVTILGKTFWLGWLMLPALAWSVVPAYFLGRAKLPLAKSIHDKVLSTDAHTNKADWMTGAAAAVIGIGLGWWWADSLAGALISFEILRDGLADLREVARRLMNGPPRTMDRQPDPTPGRVREWLRDQDWVEDAAVRIREEGHLYFGEAFVVPKGGTVEVARLDETDEELHKLDWRLHEVVLVPVPSLDEFWPGQDNHRETDAKPR